MASTHNKTFGNTYGPIHKYTRIGDHKDQLDFVLRYVQNASNYSLYKIQQCLPGAPVVCTFDPIVWLPPEVLDQLLVYLGPAACVTLTVVSKSWNRYLACHSLWYTFRNQFGISDSVLQSLGCPIDDAVHPSWLAVTRASLSVYKRMRSQDAFFQKEIIPIQEATGIGLSGPYHLTASKGLICQYAMHKWAMYDMTSKEILSRFTPDVESRDKITCMRFVDTTNAPKYRPEGIILYGSVMGNMCAALPFAGSTTYTERFGIFHNGSIVCCDADAQLDIMASAATDGSFIVWRLSSATQLITTDVYFDVQEVHIFPIQNEKFNIIAYGLEKCIQYQWPAKRCEEAESRRHRTRIGILQFLYNNVELYQLFGEFLSYTVKELPAEDTVIVKVAHKSNGTIGCLDICPNEKSNKILVFDAYTLELVQSAETKLKISRFEAAGRRFALFTTTSWALLDQGISPSFREEALVLFDLVSGQHLNYIVLPCQSVSCFSTSIRRCTSYDTQWLDELPVDAVLAHDWLESSILPHGDFGEDDGELSDSCSSLSTLSDAEDESCPAAASAPAQGAAAGAAASPLVYRPRPKSPVLYITYSNSQVFVVTWKLAPRVKPKPLKTKQE